MTDKEKIHKVIKKRYEYWKEKEFNSHSIESEIRKSECQHLLLMIDSLQEESPTVYVITRCEEHSDYVEKVFLDYNKAVDYCGQFEGNENEYGRDITKIEVTL